jgi:hypothetical protein
MRFNGRIQKVTGRVEKLVIKQGGASVRIGNQVHASRQQIRQETTMRQLTYGDIRAGQALPWDVFSAAGALLVRKGYCPASDTHVDNLVARGFIDAPLAGDTAAAPVAEPPSVLRLLNHAVAELEPLLHRIDAGSAGVQGALEQVALLVSQAVEIQPEVAAACILHNQQAAPYAVRHCVDTAVVAQIVARAVKRPADEIRAMTLAALTMNVGMLRLQDERGSLSDAEKALVRAHPERGVQLLRQAGITDPVWLDCVLSHHENEDAAIRAAWRAKRSPARPSWWRWPTATARAFRCARSASRCCPTRRCATSCSKRATASMRSWAPY